MRVVIVAEHASAEFGGEAFLPLNYFRILRSRNIPVWLVVHSRTQAELETLFPDAIDRMHFVPDTRLHRWLYQSGQLLPRRVSENTIGLLMHLYTQWLQRQIVQQLVHQHQIDIVHEPIPVSPKSPSLMFAVDAPVVIGPMNGGIDYPPAFQFRQSPWVDRLVYLGRQLSNLCNRIIPGKLQAQTLLVANQRTKQALPAGVKGNVFELVENGVDLSVWRSSTPVLKEPQQPVRFVYIGRLIDWKGIDLLLEAFQPVAQQTGACLDIIGQGGLQPVLEEQVKELGLTEHVAFLGWLPQVQCAERLQQSDALVLASLLECGGAVILEAMAMGLPVIATRWGGPIDYIDSTCGILIEPASKDALVQGFTDAMLKLAQSPELRLQLGKAGWKRILEHFDWERKVDHMLEIYQKTLSAWQVKR